MCSTKGFASGDRRAASASWLRTTDGAVETNQNRLPGCVLSGRGQHAVPVQVRKLPLVGAPELALDLMHLNLASAPEREFRTQADLSHILDRDGIDLAKEDVQELASGPPALVPFAELGRLAA